MQGGSSWSWLESEAGLTGTEMARQPRLRHSAPVTTRILYERILLSGLPDSPDVLHFGLREILIEARSGEVTREIGIGLDGVPAYKHPSDRNRPSFRGLFDCQRVSDDIGSKVASKDFSVLWDRATQLEIEGRFLVQDSCIRRTLSS